ncbi:TetR/AcrR family transcriptional regulator [Rhodococcus daqingensis]|uniref:TetR/AcrR family transcriptional regulator n=1 Tax=Rhodococcus daqingensis TaxID=2479363 RepID=A0ABW2RRJ9_9NOCA
MARVTTSARRPYAPRVPAEQRREQLLDAALDLINAGGVAAVSVDSVAKAVGVTRPVVYGQFDDADHILRALLEREGERALAQIVASLPDDLSGTDPVETFTLAARGFFAAVVECPSRWQSILLPVDGGAPEPVRRFKDRTEELILARFAEITRWYLAGREGAAEVDVDLLVRFLLGGLQEGGRQLLRDPDVNTPERLTDFARFLVETLLLRYPLA